MSTDNAAKAKRPRTLMQAHDALVGIRPERNASLAVWKSYYERSVALYREIAEIDRSHHHEALYWADREQEKINEIEGRTRAKKPQESLPDAGRSRW